MVATAFYDKLAAIADRLVRKFGSPGMLQRPSADAYDPNDATVDDGVAEPANQAIVAAAFPYDERLIDGTVIQRGDKQMFVSVVGVTEISNASRVLWPDAAPETYTVINHKELGPAGINVLYELQVRK